jgi:hypothetical protein
LPEEYKKKLEELIVKKHLKDSAYFITEHFGFELEPSQCEQKLTDTFRAYETLAPSEEEKIRGIGRLLDSLSTYAFPDVTLWNTKLLSGTETSLLERVCSEEEVIESLNKGLIHYDKNNLKKQTFLFDDFIQITDSQAIQLDKHSKQELLKYLIRLLSPDVKEVEQNTRFLSLWRFYRNLRSYYWQDAGKLPGQKQEGMQNYLRKSYIGAYVHVHECFPSEKEINSVNLKKLKELVLKMQTAQ